METAPEVVVVEETEVAEQSKIVSWPSANGSMEDVVARGVIKGGLWLAVILGGLALLVAVGKVSFDSYQKEASKSRYGSLNY